MSQNLYEKQLVKINLDHQWGLWDLWDSIFTHPGAPTHSIIPNHFKTERHLKIRSANLFTFSKFNNSIVDALPTKPIARGQGSTIVPPVACSLYRVNTKS